MKKSLLHIVLPLALVLVVNDYVWIQYLQDPQTYTEVERQNEDKLEECEEPELENDFGSGGGFLTASQIFTRSQSYYFKTGNVLTIHSERADRRLFILYQQLKLYC